MVTLKATCPYKKIHMVNSANKFWNLPMYKEDMDRNGAIISKAYYSKTHQVQKDAVTLTFKVAAWIYTM